MKNIVFSDIDGTLLTNDRNITPLTLQAVFSLQKKGIPFVIISARSPSGIYPLMKRYGISCPIISFSGALLLDENRNVLFHRGMKKEVASAVISLIEEEKMDCSWNAYSFEEWIVKSRDDPRVRKEESNVKANSQEGTIDSLTEDEVHKILCICNKEKTEEIEKRLQEKFPTLSIVKSSPILLEIMEQGITKAAAVRKLCEIWKVNIEDTIAFGDNYNDEEMLLEVGKGFLMGNAPDLLKKKISLHTLDNEHDGIYVALKKLGFVD